MSFLKKLGSILLKGTQIAMGIMPVVQQAYPTNQGVQQAADTLTTIAGVVTQVEVIGQALQQPGPQKLIAATPLVAQVILQSALMARHEIADPVKFNLGCQQVASGVCEILNSLKDNVDTLSKT
jgi:hypothetical protein